MTTTEQVKFVEDDVLAIKRNLDELCIHYRRGSPSDAMPHLEKIESFIKSIRYQIWNSYHVSGMP